MRVSGGEIIWSTGRIWDRSISFNDAALQACLSDQTLAYRIVQLVPQRLTVGALDRQTGQKLWEWSSDDQLAGVSNACRIASGYGQVYLPTRHGLFAFRERDGLIHWHIWPNTDLALAQLVIVPQA